MKKNAIRYLLELIIVAFGVFLGTLVSNWNEQRKLEEEASRAVNNIIKELESNINSLENSIAYRGKLKTGFLSVEGKFTEEVKESNFFKNNYWLDSIPNWFGPNIQQLENSIFESVKIAGIIQNFKLETIQLISSAYSEFERYSTIDKTILDKFVSIDSNTKTGDIIRLIELLVHDVLSFEIELKSQLEETIKKLKANKP